MGQVSSRGMEGIANQAFPLLATANLTFSHQDLTERGYQKIYDMLRENEWLPKFEPKIEKSVKASEELRTEANQRYIRFGASKDILMLYTKAICAAQPDSKEIALAYASRSSVTFDLKEYHGSINDLNRALAGHYPAPKSKLYARRGRCYLALSQYSQALEDFNQAKLCLQDDSTTDTTDKKQIGIIDTLIKQCQNKRDKPQEPPPDTIKLSHPPSSYIQSASAAVDIRFSPEFGRHVVALVDIKPGDILAIEKPYTSVLRPEHIGNFFCDYCKIRSFSTVPCMSCTSVVFCSEECRQSSWNAYHSIECGILPTLVSMSHSNNIEGGVEMKTFLAIRILNLASKCGKEMDRLITEAKNSESVSPESAGFVDGQYLSDDYTAIDHLVTNLESRTRQKLAQLAVYATCLVHLLKEGTEFFENAGSSVLSEEVPECQSNLSPKNVTAADMLFKYLMMVHINSQAIGETVWSKGEFPSGRTIAGAVFAFHSLFNHSCDPNVTSLAFKGDTFCIIAIQPIKKGQQIFQDYGYNYNAESIYERQTELKKHYNFTCRCIACLNNWPSYQFLPERPNIKRADAKRSIMDYIRRFRSVRNQVFQGDGTDTHLEFLSQFMILAHENVQLPWRQYVDCQDTIKCYMALKSHPEVLKKTH